MSLIGRLPWFTLLLFATTLGIYVQTQRYDATLQAVWYGRADLLDGEIWRLLTGHLVHFSYSHLAGNLLAFGALAVLIERQQGWKLFGTLFLFLAIAGSVLMLLLVPQLHYYGGISAINYGLLTWMCLTHAAVRQSFTFAGWSILPANLVVAGLFVHVGFQYASGASLFSTAPAQSGIIVAWQAHLACTMTALILALAGKTLVRKPGLIAP